MLLQVVTRRLCNCSLRQSLKTRQLFCGSSPKLKLHVQSPVLVQLTRRISSSTVQTSTQSDGEQWKKIYALPSIRTIRLLCRLKLYQTGMTIILVPVMLGSYNLGYASLTDVVVSLSVATFASVMLIVLTHYFQRCVGAISYREDLDQVQIGTLDFWGKRKNHCFSSADLVRLSELPDYTKDVYITLRTYNSDDYFYLSLKYGVIVDRNLFTSVFGRMV